MGLVPGDFIGIHVAHVIDGAVPECVAVIGMAFLPAVVDFEDHRLDLVGRAGLGLGCWVLVALGLAVRERLRDPFDRSVNVARLESAELARRIRDDGIDVLIDFNQMTAMTRVEVMAWRPAPLQIQWLGMPGSLGAGDAVDYVIVDPWVVDAANADGFSECLLQLPRSYQPNDHTPPDLELCPNRGQAGLPAEGVVFGSGHNR